MKFSDYLIVFILIFAAFSAIVFYSINTESKAGIAAEEYTSKLTAACEDAIKMANMENIEKNSLWGEQSERTKTLDAFYKTLQAGFNVENSNAANEIKAYVPVVCLIDLDGYYISYNSAFDDSGNPIHVQTNVITGENRVDFDEELRDSQTMTVSPLNTWTVDVDGCYVQFYLNNNIKLTIHSAQYGDGKYVGKTYFGQREDIIAKFKQDGIYAYINEASPTKLSLRTLLEDDKYFAEQRDSLITKEINENIEYYINQQNVLARDLGITYDYEIPDIKSEDWHRAISKPTCISFLQGFQMRTRTEFVNVYSLAGGELIKRKKYFIWHEATSDGKETRMYHLLENGACNGKVTYSTNDKGEIFWNYGGTAAGKITEIYNTMEECAAKGATPCSCCKNLNNFED